MSDDFNDSAAEWTGLSSVTLTAIAALAGCLVWWLSRRKKSNLVAANWAGVFALTLTAMAALAGGLAWWFSRQSSLAKDKGFEKFKEDSRVAVAKADASSAHSLAIAAQAKERASESEKAAALARVELIKLQLAQRWRTLDADGPFRRVLLAKRKGQAQIVYLPEDSEAYLFACSIAGELEAAGWTVEDPPSAGWPRETGPSWPFALREGGLAASNTPALIIQSSAADELPRRPFTDDTSAAALAAAFHAAGFEPMFLVPHEGLRPAKGVWKIVVGSRL